MSYGFRNLPYAQGGTCFFLGRAALGRFGWYPRGSVGSVGLFGRFGAKFKGVCTNVVQIESIRTIRKAFRSQRVEFQHLQKRG